MRWEFEFEFVPIIATLAFDAYTSSILGDNCFWGFYNYHTLLFNTRVTKNIKQCGYNFKNVVQKADNLLDVVPQLFKSDLITCDYDELMGNNRQDWKFMSGRLVDLILPTSIAEFANQDDYWFTSHCFGSLDWAGFLIPPKSNGKSPDWWKAIFPSS